MKDLTDAVLYCINMKNRPDRRKLFNSQSALQTLPPIQYVDAIQGSKLNVTNDKRIGLQTRIQVLLSIDVLIMKFIVMVLWVHLFLT